jgi:hypothetical protein
MLENCECLISLFKKGDKSSRGKFGGSILFAVEDIEQK